MGEGKKRARGSVLIVAMVVLFALAGLVLTMNRSARVDAALAANTQGARQADVVERGAEQYILAMLTDYRDSLVDMTETDFSNVPVGDGYFWIIRPNYDDESLETWGLLDESSKLNLNNLTDYNTLRALPGMTDEIAGAIVDWRDADDSIQQNGAESEAYLNATDGYRAKNADFESVEELLLVKGMTRELLYGPADLTGKVITDYYQQHGLADFFTVWTQQPNTAADGTTRLNINIQPAQTRQLMQSKLGASRGDQAMNSLGAGPVVDIFDFAVKTQLTNDEFEKIADYLMVLPLGRQASQPSRGLVNINAAPREVLVTLTARTDVMLSEADIDALLARRRSAATDTPGSIAWVYDVLKNKAIGLGNRITGQGRQYSAEIIAVSRNGWAFKRVKIVVDTTQTPARIVYRRDITDRGLPAGQELPASLNAYLTDATKLNGMGGPR